MIKHYISLFLPKRLASALWLNKPKLQEYFFRLSLNEIGIEFGEIKINHYEGTCWHKKTGWVPICFPSSMLVEIEKIDKTKTSNYFFSGVITEQRKWLNKYQNTYNSYYGRNVSTKYILDLTYYKKMSSSFFGLSPVGDCPWSYRFFEAIMCKSIPILGDNDNDIYSKNFFHSRDSEKHIYDVLDANENYKRLLQNHVLLNIL